MVKKLFILKLFIIDKVVFQFAMSRKSLQRIVEQSTGRSFGTRKDHAEALTSGLFCNSVHVKTRKDSIKYASRSNLYLFQPLHFTKSFVKSFFQLELKISNYDLF